MQAIGVVNRDDLDKRAHWLRNEIKRISYTTLRGNFMNIEDREFWIARMRKLNSELSAVEDLLITKKPAHLIGATS